MMSNLKIGEPKQADLIISLMDLDKFTYDQDDNLYVICKDIAEKSLIISPTSERYKGIISQRYIARHRTVPDTKHHKAAILVKMGETTTKTDLYIRIAGEGIGTQDATIYYDLCNNDEAIQIKPSSTGDGVTIIDRPLRFKDTGLCGEQVKPNLDAKIEDVKKFYGHIKIKPPVFDTSEQQNLSEETLNALADKDKLVERRKFVLLAWTIYNLIPDTKSYKLVRPGVKITGPQGSAKSFNETKIVSIPDPVVEELHRKPDDLESFGLSLYNRWIPAYDNIKELSDPESDMLCQAATGIDIKRRKRYTDGDTVGNSFRRACIINGISDILTRPDAAERYIPVELQKLDPSEYDMPDDVMKKFRADLPEILGASFKILSILLYKMTGELPKPKTGHRLIQFLTIGRVICDIIEPENNVVSLMPEYNIVLDPLTCIIRKASTANADDFENEFLAMMDAQETGMTDMNIVASAVITYIENGPKQTEWSKQITFKRLRDDILNDMAANGQAKESEYKALQAMTAKDFKRELMTFLKGIGNAGIEIKIIEPTPGVKQGRSAFSRLKYRRTTYT